MTDEDKKEQEDLAALQFSVDEIQKITGNKIDIDSFDRGRLKAQAEVRKSIFKLATQGSSPAQKQFLDLISDQNPGPAKKEVDKLLKWATGQEGYDYPAGVKDTLNFIYNGGKNPKELF